MHRTILCLLVIAASIDMATPAQFRMRETDKAPKKKLTTGTPMPWSEADALMYYTFALASFCQESTLQSWSCAYCGSNGTAGFTPVAVFGSNSNETFGYAGTLDASEQIIVAFRGEPSTNLQTWVTGLQSDTTQTSFPYVSGSTVYQQFYEEYLDLATNMFGAVGKLVQANPSYTVVLTGHSYGAAMATLAAAELASKTSTPINLWTYAAPRVGDPAFATGLNSMLQTSWRHTYEKDIVVHFPAQPAFQHVATEYFFNNGAWTQCDGSGEDPSCSDQFTSGLSPLNTFQYFGVPQQCAAKPPAPPATSSSSGKTSSGGSSSGKTSSGGSSGKTSSGSSTKSSSGGSSGKTSSGGSSGKTSSGGSSGKTSSGTKTASYSHSQKSYSYSHSKKSYSYSHSQKSYSYSHKSASYTQSQKSYSYSHQSYSHQSYSQTGGYSQSGSQSGGGSSSWSHWSGGSQSGSFSSGSGGSSGWSGGTSSGGWSQTGASGGSTGGSSWSAASSGASTGGSSGWSGASSGASTGGGSSWTGGSSGASTGGSSGWSGGSSGASTGGSSGWSSGGASSGGSSGWSSGGASSGGSSGWSSGGASSGGSSGWSSGGGSSGYSSGGYSSGGSSGWSSGGGSSYYAAVLAKINLRRPVRVVVNEAFKPAVIKPVAILD